MNVISDLETSEYKALRKKPPEVWVTSGQKLWTEIIYIILQMYVQLF